MELSSSGRHFGRIAGRKRFWHAAGFFVCAAIAIWLWSAELAQIWAALSNLETLSGIIDTGGPIAVVVLLALAVVVSPIPSGPIAMAAGAILGPVMGGGLTALGAILGAMIAFALSRGLGYRPLSASKLPMAHWITRPRTQARLALAVLVSRLIPFISFDAVSYVAGLTTIKPGYFAVATSIGVLPASFAFAAIGAGMAELDSALLMIAACGVTIILPISMACLGAFRKRRT
ncbi:MAG: VTT domain-containing protein [Pseudomonadota bacterium]